MSARATQYRHEAIFSVTVAQFFFINYAYVRRFLQL